MKKTKNTNAVHFFDKDKSAVKMVAYIKVPTLKDVRVVYYSATSLDKRDDKVGHEDHEYAVERLVSKILNVKYPTNWRKAIFYDNKTGAKITELDNAGIKNTPRSKEPNILHFR